MREYLRYVFGVIAVILVIILFFFGFSLLRKVVRRADTPDTKKVQTTTAKVATLSKDYTNQPIIYTITGAINGNEEHYSIRTTVTPTVRRVEVLRGYDNQVIKSQDTANTQDAYNAFVTALDGAGFTKKTTSDKDRGIENQSCLLGRRYNYLAAPTSTNNYSTWSTSCSSGQGTFGGNHGLVEELFQRQIPNYSTVVRGTKLS